MKKARRAASSVKAALISVFSNLTVFLIKYQFDLWYKFISFITFITLCDRS